MRISRVQSVQKVNLYNILQLIFKFNNIFHNLNSEINNQNYIKKQTDSG